MTRRRFENKTALVTGAGSGIGGAIASHLALEGARIGALDRNLAGAEETVERIKGHQGRARALRADVRSQSQIEDAVAECMDHVGPIDVLVNCAGAAIGETFDDTPPGAWNDNLAINLTGPYLVCWTVIPLMLERGGGAIVNISSVNALQYFGNPAYSAAKAGLVNYTKSLASEYGGRGIRANSVLPGTIFSPAHEQRMKKDPGFMTKLGKWYPGGRVGRAEEVAAAVAFLASDEASFINGADLVVDGGLTAGLKRMADELTLRDQAAD